MGTKKRLFCDRTFVKRLIENVCKTFSVQTFTKYVVVFWKLEVLNNRGGILSLGLCKTKQCISFYQIPD